MSDYGNINTRIALTTAVYVLNETLTTALCYFACLYEAKDGEKFLSISGLREVNRVRKKLGYEELPLEGGEDET